MAPGGPETPEHILYECLKYNRFRDRLWERILMAWPPTAGCGEDTTRTSWRSLGRVMRLILEEEPLHRQ